MCDCILIMRTAVNSAVRVHLVAHTLIAVMHWHIHLGGHWHERVHSPRHIHLHHVLIAHRLIPVALPISWPSPRDYGRKASI